MSSIFDIIGPIMVGPSSSHTAGAVNIGRAAREVLGAEPIRASITLYGSFAQTYRGHGTDRALVAGILGMKADDPGVCHALETARKKKIKVDFHLAEKPDYHPNTARIELFSKEQQTQLVGASIGGGRIRIREIDGFEVSLSGEYHAMICAYTEQLGVVAKVSSVLASEAINIAFMRVSRNDDRDRALMIVEVDQPLTKRAIQRVKRLRAMDAVKYLRKMEF